MDDKFIQNLSVKIDTIIKLMVLGMTEGKNQVDQVMLLAKAGFKPKEIAETLDTTPNTVRVALSKLRKEKPRRKVG
jgi:DNA-directed RNA polymerase specialized sigma24 family protein